MHLHPDDEDDWQPFANGKIDDAHGGSELVRLTERPRAFSCAILMTGVRIQRATFDDVSRPLALRFADSLSGKWVRMDVFMIAFRSAPDRHRQTIIYASSTDPGIAPKTVDYST